MKFKITIESDNDEPDFESEFLSAKDATDYVRVDYVRVEPAELIELGQKLLSMGCGVDSAIITISDRFRLLIILIIP
jgi:hypothetical protein